MLEFRPLNYETEIDEVVVLIKQNLQPKYTREFLVWKHVDNPFGTSLSIIATYDGKIVGVLFYMRYNFYNNKGELIKCIRPFDACTSPKMRGKGIFKKLMTEGLERYKNNYHVLLANPNSNSHPEFLKLGWIEPNHNYMYKFGIIAPKKIKRGESLTDISKFDNSSELLSSQDLFQVGNSLEFVQWRYKDPSYKKMKFETLDKGFLYLVYRKERIKGVVTIILCDTYGNFNLLKKAISRILAIEGSMFVYYLENQINKDLSPVFSFKHKKALIVLKENNYRTPDNFMVSLGDLEGKL